MPKMKAYSSFDDYLEDQLKLRAANDIDERAFAALLRQATRGR